MGTLIEKAKEEGAKESGAFGPIEQVRHPSEARPINDHGTQMNHLLRCKDFRSVSERVLMLPTAKDVLKMLRRCFSDDIEKPLLAMDAKLELHLEKTRAGVICSRKTKTALVFIRGTVDETDIADDAQLWFVPRPQSRDGCAEDSPKTEGTRHCGMWLSCIACSCCNAVCGRILKPVCCFLCLSWLWQKPKTQEEEAKYDELNSKVHRGFARKSERDLKEGATALSQIVDTVKNFVKEMEAEDEQPMASPIDVQVVGHSLGSGCALLVAAELASQLEDRHIPVSMTVSQVLCPLSRRPSSG